MSHGHILINGIRVKAPSYQIKPGDVFEVKEKTKTGALLKERLQSIRALHLDPPGWIIFDVDAVKGKIDRMPHQDELEQGIDTRLIVEYYSR